MKLITHALLAVKTSSNKFILSHILYTYFERLPSGCRFHCPRCKTLLLLFTYFTSVYWLMCCYCLSAYLLYYCLFIFLHCTCKYYYIVISFILFFTIFILFSLIVCISGGLLLGSVVITSSANLFHHLSCRAQVSLKTGLSALSGDAGLLFRYSRRRLMCFKLVKIKWTLYLWCGMNARSHW